MEHIGKFKMFLVTALGAVSSFLGILFIPVMLMIMCNISDYATGLMASASRGEEISSYKSIKGIFKKVGMWFLVFIGWMMDIVIDYSLNTLGLQLNIPSLENFTWPCAVACIVALWIVVSEIISIKENVKAMGTDVPAFVDKITDGMLDSFEKAVIKEVKETKKQELDDRMDDDLK